MDCPRCQAPNPDTQSFCGQCGTGLQPDISAAGDVTRPSTQPRDELETGSTFAGRYQIIEELGRGGMGRVYKVIDKEVHAKIALKLIRPEIASDRATIDRFRNELKTAREISHKNICRMYDLGHDGATYFLTMEYVSGQDLKSMIAMSGQLGVGTAISIAKQACDGLAEAHRLGIVHRDLKPQNIQIDKGGHAKIMDFGIARSVMAKGLTEAGVVIGTAQYMSPEQVEAKEIDARSDLYSLGVIAYEMLTGRVPFDGDTALSVAMKQKLEEPRDPRELNAAIPTDLDRLILKCLEKDKDDRYQSAEELHADLVRIEQGLPTTQQVVPQQRPATSKEIAVPFTMRQLLVPALVLVAVLAVAVGAWRTWPRKAAMTPPATGKPTLAVLYFENISGDPSLATWRTGLPELLTTGLFESRILDVVPSDRMFSILKKLNLADAPRYSAEDLASVAKEGNALYLLTGSVMKAGQSIVITTRLQKAATGEVVRSEKVECKTEQDILSKVDVLARGIKADLSLSPEEIAGDSSQPLGEVLTRSAEALKYYTEARRFHLNSANRDAIRLYERAIEADPGFAMAYRGVAACYGNTGEFEKEAVAAKKAMELSDRLPERLRYQIQITAYSTSDATYPQAIDACNKLLAMYADDGIGLTNLALIYENAEDFEKSVPLQEAAARVSPDYLGVGNLASGYMYLGDYEKAISTLERYLKRDPKNATAHVDLGWNFLSAGNLEGAQREAETASLLAPLEVQASLLKGDVAHLRGAYAESEREYSSIVAQGTEANRRTARRRLANLYMTMGRFQKAREQVPGLMLAAPWVGGSIELASGHPDNALTAIQPALADPLITSRSTYALQYMAMLGLSYAAMGNSSEAQKVASEIRSKGQEVFARPATRLSLAVSGADAIKRGDGRTAVADLERSVSMMPHQCYVGEGHAVILDLLAQAYMTSGDLAKARETYEKITALTTGRMGWGPYYARSFYNLGLIAERQGDTARAREQLSRFLEIWKNADPGLPEVADAKKRLK